MFLKVHDLWQNNKSSVLAFLAWSNFQTKYRLERCNLTVPSKILSVNDYFHDVYILKNVLQAYPKGFSLFATQIISSISFDLEAHVSTLSLLSSMSSAYLSLCCRRMWRLFFLFFSSFFFFFLERNKSRFLSYSSTVLKETLAILYTKHFHSFICYHIQIKRLLFGNNYRRIFVPFVIHVEKFADQLINRVFCFDFHVHG